MIALEKLGITIEEFIKICNESISMSEAIRKTKLHRRTFTKYAKQLECFKPNQGLKGGKKEIKNHKFKIEDWENDIIIDISRASLRKNIFDKKLLPHKCNKCQLENWNELPIPLELNHINGEGHENRRTNIELICPNCHAQTDTYRGKNLIKKYGKKEQIYNPIKAKAYREKTKSNVKPINKWHTFKKTKKQFKEERKIEFNKIRLDKINKVLNSGIDFTKYGWRVKLGEILNMTAQYSGTFVKKHIPEIWDKAYKHKEGDIR